MDKFFLHRIVATSGKATGYQPPATSKGETPEATSYQQRRNAEKPPAGSRKQKKINKIPTVVAILTILLLTTTSCTQKTFSSKKELWTYIKDPENGYAQSKSINGIDYTVYYKPTDLLVDQELDTIDKATIAKLRNKYGQYLYFTLTLSKNGKELLGTAPNRQEFGRMVNQLSFGMGEKVHLYTQKKDTLNLLDYSAPRMYGMSPTTNILFVYPKGEKYLEEDYLTLSVEDFGLNTGEVKFKITTDKIKNEPRLW